MARPLLVRADASFMPTPIGTSSPSITASWPSAFQSTFLARSTRDIAIEMRRFLSANLRLLPSGRTGRMQGSARRVFLVNG